jgi:hypothetical protein
MIITDDWTFVHIPRTGGVSLKLAYLDSLGVQQGVHYQRHPYECQFMLRPTNEGFHNEPPLNTFGSEHALVNHWESWIPENSQLFTIVRNPYDRFQSICRRGYDISLTDEDRANSLDVDYVLSHEGWSCWKPAATQKSYLDSTTKNITVYKFETQLQAAYEDHGFTFADHSTEPSGNGNQNNASQNQTDILTPENIEKINAHFHDDFVEFGYSKR